MTRLADISVAIAEWAVGRLCASTDLQVALETDAQGIGSRIWDSPPGPEEPMPYILVNVVEPRDWGGVGLTEVCATGELTVQAIGPAESYDPLLPHASAIHAALQNQVNQPISGGGLLMSCQRTRAIAYPEQTQGIEYRHIGGSYRVTAQ